MRNFFKRVDLEFLAWVIIATSFLLSSLFVISKGPSLGNDSYSYLNMAVHRPPGYPLFLFLMKLFGESNLIVTVVVQTLINAAAIIFFIHKIRRIFNLNILYSLIVLPLTIYFFVEVVRPQNILTESVAFPLFLILSSYFIDSLINRNMKGLLIAMGINVLLVLVRGQFLFLYPLFLIQGIYLVIRNRTYWNVKSVSLFATVLITSFGSTILINKSYHYILHDTFSDTQSYMSFIRGAFYISEKDDYLLFEDELLKGIHREVYDSLYNAGLNAEAFYDKINPDIPVEDRRRSDLVTHYHKSLITISHILNGKLIRDNYREYNEVEFSVQRDEIFREISRTLIKENISLYFYLVASEIMVYGFNADRVYLLSITLFILISVIGLLRENRMSEAVFFFLIAHLLNLITMALSNRVLGRYMIYEEFVILMLLFVIFIRVMIPATKQEVS